MGKTMTAMERAKKVVTDWLWESRDMTTSDSIAHLEVVAAREFRAAATTLPQAEREAGRNGLTRRHIHSGDLTVWWTKPWPSARTKAALVWRLYNLRVEIEKGMGEAERGLTRRLTDAQASTLMDVCQAFNLAADDYLTVVHGPPRYRKFGSTWWRCVGTLRLDSSQNILRHDRNASGWVTYSEGIKRIIANGHASTFYTLSAASYVPPIAGVVRIFFLVIYSTAQIYGHVRTTGSGATTGYDVEGYTKCSETFELHCSPNQAIDYLSSDASASCFLDVYGYLEEL